MIGGTVCSILLRILILPTTLPLHNPLQLLQGLLSCLAVHLRLLLLSRLRRPRSTRSSPRLILLLHPLRIPHQLILSLLVAARNQTVEKAAGTTLRVTFLLGLFDLVMKVAGGLFVEFGVVVVVAVVDCEEGVSGWGGE